MSTPLTPGRYGSPRRNGSQNNMLRIPSYMRPQTAMKSARIQTITIPKDFLLRDLKEKREFRLLSRKLTMFVTFVAIYLAVLLMDRNISGRAFVRSIISKEIIETSRANSSSTFQMINSPGSFYDWFANSFIETVYATTDSDGFPLDVDAYYTIATHTVIVGGFHMIQSRYAAVNSSAVGTYGDPCYSLLVPTLGQTCYSSKIDSVAPYGLGPNTMNTNWTMFQYTTTDKLSGFQTFFLRSSTNGVEERARVQYMREHRWIDQQTKDIQITMPLYNHNLKLWSIVQLTIEFDLAGGVTPSSFIHVTSLEPYDFSNRKNVLRGILEIIFVAHVFYFFFLELYDICVLSNGSLNMYMHRYGLVNNLGDWANIIVNAAICLWRYMCQTNPVRSRMLALETFETYVPAMSLAEWDDILLAMNIFNMLLLTGRTLKYFQVTNGGRRLMQSVYGAMPEVLSFLPIYIAVIIGYTFAGHMLYGLRFPEWSTFPGALFRVFEMNFGLYDPGPIYDDSGYLSAVYIYSSNVVFCILMLNVFMAIVMSTWEQLSEKEAERSQERLSYSHPLTYSDMFHLLFMKEDVVDMLINVATDFGDETMDPRDVMITKSQFTKNWLETGMEVSPKTWSRFIGWYWDPQSLEESQQELALVKPPFQLGAVPTNATNGTNGTNVPTTEEAVSLVNSARDLQLNTESEEVVTKPKSAFGLPSFRNGAKASAKVVAESSPLKSL